MPHDQKLAALVAVPAILRQGLSPGGDNPVPGLVGGLIGQRQGPDLQGPLRVPAREAPPQGQGLHPYVLQGVRHRVVRRIGSLRCVFVIDIVGDLSGLGLVDPGEGILLHAGVAAALVLRQAEDPGEEVHAGGLLLIAQGQVSLAILPGQEPEEVGLAVGGVLRLEGPDRSAAPAELGGAHTIHPAEGAALLRAEAGVEAILTQVLIRLLRIEDIAAIPAEGHGAVLPHQNTGQTFPVRAQFRVGVKHLPQAEILPEGVRDAPGIHAAGGDEGHAEDPRQQQRPGLGPPEAQQVLDAALGVPLAKGQGRSCQDTPPGSEAQQGRRVVRPDAVPQLPDDRLVAAHLHVPAGEQEAEPDQGIKPVETECCKA